MGSGRIDWQDPKLYKPENNNPVLAVVEHYRTKNKYYAILIKVEEDDCEWRCFDTDTYKPELSHNFDVIKWALLPQLNLYKEG